jgi:hypothetical protein
MSMNLLILFQMKDYFRSVKGLLLCLSIKRTMKSPQLLSCLFVYNDMYYFNFL